MRVAVAGCGYWGSKHVRVLHSIPSVSQVVLIDSDGVARARTQEAFPSAVSFASLSEALVSGRIDALIVATPPATHAAVALAAIRSGLHVLVEKPLATNSPDAEQLVAEAERRGVVLMVGHTFQYNAAVHRLADAVQSGELGKIHYLDSARLNLGLYQPDCNVIWDLAPHDVSIANFVLGEDPCAVTAWGSAHGAPTFEDVALIRLDYPSNVMATIRVSWLDPCKVRRTTVVGTDKMAVYNDLNDNERIKLYDVGVERSNEDRLHEMPVSYRYGDVVAPFIDFKEPLMTEDLHFVDSIRQGSIPDTTGKDGLTVVRVLEAANQSLAEGRTIDLRPSVVAEFQLPLV